MRIGNIWLLEMFLIGWILPLWMMMMLAKVMGMVEIE